MTAPARTAVEPVGDRRRLPDGDIDGPGQGTTHRRRTSWPPSAAAWVTVLALTGWALVVATGRLWGLLLMERGVRIVLFTPPVLGGDRPEVPPGVLAAAVLGGALVVILPVAATRWRWSSAVAAATVGALTWWTGLALVDGVDGLTRGLAWDADYRDAVPRVVAGPGRFLAEYTTTLPDQPIALRGHPPGFGLLFGALDALGLRGPGWATAIVFLAGAAAVPAVLVTVRALTDERTARRAAPFVALAPAALWIGTSTDAVSMGTGAWMLALLTLATIGSTRRRVALAAAAGLLAAIVTLQSYGLVLLAVPVLAVAWHRRCWWPTVLAGGVALAATGAVAGWGFWWLDGLAATAHEYHTLDLERPYEYFAVNNLAAWALALGPATIVALTRLRDRRVWVLVGGGIGAAVAANISGLSEGEVERIWLPFTVLVLPAGAALWSSPTRTRAWLGLQVGAALVITSLVSTYW